MPPIATTQNVPITAKKHKTRTRYLEGLPTTRRCGL